MELGGFEAGQTFDATSEFMYLLQQRGVDQRLLRRVDTSAEEYGEACIRAAETAFDDILEGTGKAKARTEAAAFDLPIGAIHPHGRLTYLVRTDDRHALDDAAEEALTLKGTGAIDYMIAHSSNLRDALKRLDNLGLWSEASSFYISAYLRGLLNLELGRARVARYFPASIRAEFLDSESSHARHLAHAIADVADEAIISLQLREAAPEIPIGPIGIFLLEKSRGAPEAMIEAAVELREKLAPLRSDLEKVSLGLGSIDRRKNVAATQIAEEMKHHIRIALGYESAPSLVDCLRFDVVLGAPGNDVSVGLNPALSLAKWIRYQLGKKRYYGVADVASVFARSGVDGRHFQALKRHAMRNGTR